MLSKPKRVRSFGDDQPVGLRIVAAMSGELQQGPAKDPIVGRSDPIPIRPGAVGTTLEEKKKKKKMEEEEEEEEEEEMEEEEEEELSESYTCVTVHVGGKVVRRRVYGSGSWSGSVSVSECSGGGSVHKYGRSPGVLILESPVALSVPMAKGKGDFFLSHCYLCRKKLHGLDIFMYRGEKAFCSVECRCEQILSDEHKEKCSSEALKNQDSSYSPSPLLFAAGVAAA